MDDMKKCKKCEHNSKYAQGRYCRALEKFIYNDQQYPYTCGKFSPMKIASKASHGAVILDGTFECPVCKFKEKHLASCRFRR